MNPDPAVSQAALTMPAQPIREMMALASRVPDAIHLEVGEPDAATPSHIARAAAEAARLGKTTYAPNAGIPALRQALAAKVCTRNGYDATPEQIIVTNGGIEALYSTMLALVGPGDEVLLPDPAWPNFRTITHLTGARPILYPCAAEDEYKPRADLLERLVTEQTKVVVLVTPSNPTGAILGTRDIEAIAAFAAAHGLWILSDECYDEITYDDSFVSVATVAPPERVISVYSFSKVYAMTGWRVGYAVVPASLAPTIERLQEPIISCVNMPAQFAALEAVTGPQDAVRDMLGAYRLRRDRALETLSAAGLPAFPPAGAFYVWIDVSSSGLSSADLARSLLDQEGVAVAPGIAFGPSGEGFVRLSLAAAADDVIEGTRRLASFLRAASGSPVIAEPSPPSAASSAL